ncbi:DedA family protein [Mixta calida]|uniref:DedA family protein n=1 Tax=Mixta calida TaxID=665913 RepID=UPI000535CD18|nr:DedA family protein [Mixta calida]AIX74877.1 membrane protein [Pantoea sp. PSNIH2]POU49387.1 DedA family protein [Pantoea sp. PSNIH5]POU67390.1 DedA family protein [Pantoea sp. PSNIH4]POY68946.1 DedA family protein [Pantoea sp. PSNIH3]MDU4288231.1 DedA family protein [Mixta calida]
MEAWLEHLITQSLEWALFAVALVTFLESLALVGLLLPGTVMMASLGALVGSGQLGLYPAWGAGIVGCLLGDWISYGIGWKFQGPLHRWQYLKKHQKMLDRTEHALHQHSMFTILVGRFVGPTRPLIPLAAGMLELPVRKFLPPNIIGCLLWPPLYLLPGILAGVAIDVPKDAQSGNFIWLLLAVALLAWIGSWLCWRWWRAGKQQDWATPYLTTQRLRWLAPLGFILGAGSLIAIQFHPMMPIFRQLLVKVFIG